MACAGGWSPRWSLRGAWGVERAPAPLVSIGPPDTVNHSQETAES